MEKLKKVPRKQFRSGTIADVKKRNEKMFNDYQKLLDTGKRTKMEIYQKLATKFGFGERNSVYAIIKKMLTEKTESLNEHQK